MRRRGFKVGKLLLTTTRQGVGAPFLDGGSSQDDEGQDYGCFVLRLPWTSFALVAGWRGALSPIPRRWRHRMSVAIARWVAYRLPTRVRYWVLIREGAERIGPDEVVPEVSFTQILERSDPDLPKTRV